MLSTMPSGPRIAIRGVWARREWGLHRKIGSVPKETVLVPRRSSSSQQTTESVEQEFLLSLDRVCLTLGGTALWK